jgi:hypothetical protein
MRHDIMEFNTVCMHVEEVQEYKFELKNLKTPIWFQLLGRTDVIDSKFFPFCVCLKLCYQNFSDFTDSGTNVDTLPN